MGRGRKARGQRPIKGFRPGKEPVQLRKRQVKEQLGEDAGRAQKWMVDLLVERGPDAVQRLIGRWALGAVAGGVLLAIVGVLLYRWSVAAGVAAHLIAVVLLVFWYRMRRQRSAVAEMARRLGLDRTG
jgi:Flp pilus assembly protein TadB